MKSKTKKGKGNINKHFRDIFISLQGEMNNVAFGAKCGFSESTVRKCQTGEVPGTTTLQKIAKVANKSISELLGEGIQTAEPTREYRPEQDRLAGSVFQQRAMGRLGIFIEWIEEEFGTTHIDIETGFQKLEEGCPDFREWKYMKMSKKLK